MKQWLRATALLAGAVACSQAPRSPGPAAPASPRVSAAQAFPPQLQRRVAPFPVLDSAGTPLAFPFLGGFDHPRPQLVDIDGDGDPDLFVQEYTGQMMFFERTGSATEPRYTWKTDRYADLDIGEWSRFVDLDGDGDYDLLAEARYSYIRYYRNEGDRTHPEFRLAADTLRDPAGQPIFADRQNIPQLADIDCNGKLDLFLGRVDGTITRYELQDVSPAGVPRFGFITDGFQDIRIIGQLQSRHGANTMAIADLDQDGDPDILWGDFFEPGLLWIRNEGNCRSPSMGGTPTPFPTNAPLKTSGYNAPTLGDLDADGDPDLLVGVLGGAFDPVRTSRENLHWLEQVAPGKYEDRTARYLTQIDVGTESSAAVADLDGDGDLDLVLGNKIEPDNPRTGGLYLFENTGTARSPAYREAGRIPVAPGFHLSPAFGDLDGDGDPDLVLGTWRDALVYYRNDGTGAAPRFTPADSAFVRLTRGSHASPALGDVDGDGDLDLFVGEASGTVNFYRNDGSPAEARFTLVSDEFGGIHAGRRSAPRLGDLDGDGDLDLVIGTELGPPLLFRNEGTQTNPRFVQDTTRWNWPPYSSPALGDLNGDGRLDVLVAGASGGVTYLQSVPAPE